MKKRFNILLGILFLGFPSLFAQFEIKLSEELFISKISETVFIVTHYFPWESNSLIVRASDQDVVLIDTPYDTAATSLMLDWIKANIKPEKMTAINTGFHIDNLGGNGCLLENGIDVYGSDLTLKMMDERGSKTQQHILSWLKSPEQDKYRKVYETMVFKKPNRVFRIKDGLNLEIGRISFEVYYPGESHSPDNVTVYIKEIKLLFAGCMIKSLASKNLGFTGDANMAEWPKSVKKILGKYATATLVIPHHGMWGDISLLKHTLKLFN